MSYYADYSDVVADKHKVPGYRGIPPKNFGRFIPCRGGGTDTTYYTDLHDVDEDVAAIADYGGQWMNVTGAGIFNRGLDDNPSAIWDDVASGQKLNIHSSL